MIERFKDFLYEDFKIDRNRYPKFQTKYQKKLENLLISLKEDKINYLIVGGRKGEDKINSIKSILWDLSIDYYITEQSSSLLDIDSNKICLYDSGSMNDEPLEPKELESFLKNLHKDKKVIVCAWQHFEDYSKDVNYIEYDYNQEKKELNR